MGFYDGPRVVTNGLSLYLDIADRNCYTSGSTIIYELVQSTSGSLINGPTFSSASNGNIVFDGTNDIIQLVNTGSVLATNNFTIELWCRPSNTITDLTEATSGIGALIGQRFATEPVQGTGTTAGAGVSVGTNGIVVVEHSASYFPGLLEYTGSVSSTNFSNIVITYTNKQPSAYVNGSLVKTGLTSVRTTVSLIVGRLGGMQYGYFAGNLANIKYYNRTLSSDEIKQNYEAQKTRFNL